MSAVSVPDDRVRFPWRWLALGLFAYAVFLLATLPAERVGARLRSHGVLLAGVDGTVWHGHAAAMQVNGITFGPTEWRLSFWRLLFGTVSAELHCKRDDGYLDATIGVDWRGKIALGDVRASLPIAAFARLGIPGGNNWNGTVQLHIQRATLVKGWPTSIVGDVEAVNLVGPASRPIALGGFRVAFAPNGKAASAAKTPPELRGALTSLDDSPLIVSGTLTLQPTRNYKIDAQVGKRANAPAAIDKALQFLGPPDAKGFRPFTLQGSL